MQLSMGFVEWFLDCVILRQMGIQKLFNNFLVNWWSLKTTLNQLQEAVRYPRYEQCQDRGFYLNKLPCWPVTIPEFPTEPIQSQLFQNKLKLNSIMLKSQVNKSVTQFVAPLVAFSLLALSMLMFGKFVSFRYTRTRFTVVSTRERLPNYF